MTSVIEEAKRLYMPYLDDDYRARVAALDEGDQAYFWTYLYHTLPTEIDRVWLEEAEKRAKRASRGPSGDQSATPFRDAEESVSAHGRFGRVDIWRA